MGTNVLSQTLKGFAPISLTQLNAQASFLSRIDTKYIMDEVTFAEVLKDLEKDFFVLSINDKPVQEYSSIYMDTEDYFFYNQHQNKEPSRTKIRTREYIDSKIAFFEYKQKENKVTRKFRYQFDLDHHGKMSPESTKFFEGIYQSVYGTTPEGIFPSLETKYNRLTLCSKDSAERLTIDFNIRLNDLRNEGKEEFALKNVVIIESKSDRTDGVSATIMENHGIPQAKACSKYGLGLVYQGVAKETSVFDNTVKRMDKIMSEGQD